MDDELCMNMGIEGRKLVESEFSIDKVNDVIRTKPFHFQLQ